MRLNTIDLKNVFLSVLNRMARVDVSVSSEYDGRHIQTQKSYIGAATASQVRQEALQSALPIEDLQYGDNMLSDIEIASFLNIAWEKLHLDKTLAIQGALVGETGVSQLDGMIQEHGDLYEQSPLIAHLETGAGKWHWSTDLKFIEQSMQSSIYFPIPKEIEVYGNATIISVNLEGFDNTLWAAQVPSEHRACRFVNSSELSAIVNLATNSRYAAGAMCRVRMYLRAGTEKFRCIEAFHEAKKEWGGFWDMIGTGKKTFCTFSYIRHPKPITIKDFYPPTEEAKKQDKNVQTRIIEVDYGHQIALEAAKIAMQSSMKQ